MWQYRGKIELISLAYVRTCNNCLTINVEKSIIIMYTYNSVKSKSVSFVCRDKLNHLMGDYAIFPIYIGNILKEKKYYCMYKCMNIRFCYWIIFKNSLFCIIYIFQFHFLTYSLIHFINDYSNEFKFYQYVIVGQFTLYKKKRLQTVTSYVILV